MRNSPILLNWNDIRNVDMYELGVMVGR